MEEAPPEDLVVVVLLADTWIGGGSGKAAGAHDIGGETGAVWDDGSDDPGMDRQGYLGNW